MEVQPIGIVNLQLIKWVSAALLYRRDCLLVCNVEILYLLTYSLALLYSMLLSAIRDVF